MLACVAPGPRVTKQMPGLPVGGLRGGDLRQFLARRLHLLFLEISDAEIQPNALLRRINGQRGAVIPDGFVVLTELGVNHAEVGKRVQAARNQFQGGFISLPRAVQVAFLLQLDAARKVRLRLPDGFPILQRA